MAKRRGHRSRPKTPLHKKIARQGNKGRVKPAVDSSSENGTENEGPKKGLDRITQRGGDSGKLLTNPNQVLADSRLISRAIRGRWGVRRKSMIRRRLEDVVAKTEVDVIFGTKEGPEGIPSVEVADRNAVAAARVLVQMNGQDQEDDHFEVKNKKPATPGTQVNVNVLNNTELGPSRFIQLAKSLGATELLIDGTKVPIAEVDGESSQAGGVQQGAGEQVVSNAAIQKAKELFGLK